MAKETKVEGSFTVKDKDGETYLLYIHREYAVDEDFRQLTKEHYQTSGGAIAIPRPDGSFSLLGFDEIQVWKE